MHLLFALFFSSFNGISDLPWQIVLTQKVSKKVKTGSFCLILVYIFNGIGETPSSVC